MRNVGFLHTGTAVSSLQNCSVKTSEILTHLKGKQDYGHQAVAVMLSCNGIVLNYALVVYDKSMSKVKIVQEIAKELPIPPVVSYFLCDSWYTCGDLMDASSKRGSTPSAH